MTREEVIKVVSKGGSLEGANLRNVNLIGVDLSGANLSGADLYCANLRGANLEDAILHNADLGHANLQSADLSCINLKRANLSGADLSYANLQDANLYYANLDNTNLTEAKGPLMEYRRGKVLTEHLIGYKKCRNDVIVTLEIPKGATVFSINGYKCRTNRVKVVAIDGADKGISFYDGMTSYHVGGVITIKDFDWRYNVECTTGIHFFMNKEDAENYEF